MISNLFVSFIGFASGIAVGGGFVAFLAVLGIIPRLIQLVGSRVHLRSLEWAVITGAMTGLAGSIYEVSTEFAIWLVPLVGLLAGTFIGMLAAALTEVLDVIPIVTRRLGMASKLQAIMHAIVFGKVAGSLFYWLLFIPYK
ncbi:stage V sporulation protein AB [Jeotgalibacillus soli]|uniref:Stage V sporulation protein AB n=1 Tax=Jeotgalibacillus soli TaxID=889306 RepID=A0A0C2VJS8_9BACL|nr:stage V sporulation protein AB [Jeotgalibacillus soli]KIL44253.1 stage V sporulation protein AB [Jeotgalibacillus soli]